MVLLQLNGVHAGLKVLFLSGWLQLQVEWLQSLLLDCSFTAHTPVLVQLDSLGINLSNKISGFIPGFFVFSRGSIPAINQSDQLWSQ